MSSVSASSISGPELRGGDADRQGLDLAAELRRRWEAGERPAAEEFLKRSPNLLENAEAALEVVYEEYYQREAAGDGGAEQDILGRFPQWSGLLRVMIDCHRHLIGATRRPLQFPGAGESVGEFRLLDEIARGASGRVYLAVQGALADRPVILKITPLDGAEHLTLARLQHTNIVPLYTAVDLPADNLRVLCMPYFGRATLASVLEELADVPAESRRGAMIVQAIDRLQEIGNAPEAGPRQMLALASYVEAVCWIVACLADALQFAHDRSLAHLDLKPSNILLANDGQPMLLDFHLAREPVRPDSALPESLGGTPAYMPPEQRDALSALREGRRTDVAVDNRADLYALGAILYECLGRRLPGLDPPPLESLNPHVSRGLSDIIATCLQPRPQDRYPSAAALADDLRRHLMHRPLAVAPNRSLRERWHKWRLRRPGAMRSAALLSMLATALVIVAAVALQNISQREQQARIALSDGQRQISQRHFAEAAESFARGSRLLRGIPFQADLQLELGQQLERARRLRLGQQLHEVAEQVRRLPGMGSPPTDLLRSLSQRCHELWQQRDVLMPSQGGASDAQLEADVKDIAVFAALLAARAAEQSAAGLRDALQILDEAEANFGRSAVLDYERRRCQQALGLPGGAFAHPAPEALTPWEQCALGRACLEAGDLIGAAEQLAAACASEPGSVWANYYYGLCAYRLADYEGAVAAFSVCIGANPGFADCFYNRALAYDAQGQRQKAIQDFQRAIALEPDHPAGGVLAQVAEEPR